MQSYRRGMRIFDHMRTGLLVLGMLLALNAPAQVLPKKKLFCLLGAGGTIAGFKSSWVSFATGGSSGAILDLALGYGITERWVLDVHHQRLGFSNVGRWSQRAHISRYELEGTWSAFDTGRSTLQLTAGAGAAVSYFNMWDDGESAKTTALSLSGGIRFLHLVEASSGFFIAASTSLGKEGTLTHGSEPLSDPSDDPVIVSWSAISLSAGVFVRF